MLQWIHANIGNILICLVLIAVVAAILLPLIRKRKRGEAACGCSCAHCAMCGECHSQKGTISK